MKVACIGNMNNMMFTLCRYLRDQGIDAYLFPFFNEPAHFNPSSDTYTDEYLKYTKILPINSENFTDKKIVKKAKSLLSGFDFFIGTDIAPAIFTLLNIKLNVFVPHGSDIYTLPFGQGRGGEADKIWYIKSVKYLGSLQKIGIANLEYIFFPDEYDTHFNYKKKINSKARYFNMTLPMLYTPQYIEMSNIEIRKSLKYSKEFDKIRKENKFIFFSHSRQNGISLERKYFLHQKGNDIVIRAFAKFVKDKKNIKSCLILFEYGMDVSFAKGLIEELNIKEWVIWMPKMDRKEIMYGLSLATFAAGQFVNSWLTCGVVNEVLAVDVPLIHFRENEMYQGSYQEFYSVYNCKNEKEVYLTLIGGNEKYQEGMKGSLWLEKYSVAHPIKNIIKLINDDEVAVRGNVLLRLNIMLLTFFYKNIIFFNKLKLRMVK